MAPPGPVEAPQLTGTVALPGVAVAVTLVGAVSVLTLPLALPAPLPVKYAHAIPATSKPPKAKPQR